MQDTQPLMTQSRIPNVLLDLEISGICPRSRAVYVYFQPRIPSQSGFSKTNNLAINPARGTEPFQKNCLAVKQHAHKRAHATLCHPQQVAQRPWFPGSSLPSTHPIGPIQPCICTSRSPWGSSFLPLGPNALLLQRSGPPRARRAVSSR
jgi:hypothetical protein